MRLNVSLAAMMIVLISTPSYSHEISTGEWNGYIILSDSGEKESVSFHVSDFESEDGKSYKITMVHNEQPYVFKELNVTNGKIIFRLDTGTLYDCDLSLQNDGSYSGDCIGAETDQEKNKISVTMNPKESSESPHHGNGG